MADISPPNPATPTGQLRYIINDVEEPYVFTDAHLSAVISIYRDNLQIAAADLLESIAVDEALLYKYVRTDDLSVDGTKAANILMERAKRLREQADLDAIEEDFIVVSRPSTFVTPETVTRWL